MTHESLARKLRILRAARGITLAEAEELTGVTRETLGALEHGQRGAYTSTLEKIARGYGVTVSALLSEVEEPEAELALAGSSPKAKAPREAGQSLLERAQDAARRDEKKEAQAVNRLFASEGKLPATHIMEFEEDRFRAELRARGFPDEYFESFIWPLVTTVNQQEREISRLRKLEAPAQAPSKTEPGVDLEDLHSLGIPTNSSEVSILNQAIGRSDELVEEEPVEWARLGWLLAAAATSGLLTEEEIKAARETALQELAREQHANY